MSFGWQLRGLISFGVFFIFVSVFVSGAKHHKGRRRLGRRKAPQWSGAQFAWLGSRVRFGPIGAMGCIFCHWFRVWRECIVAEGRMARVGCYFVQFHWKGARASAAGGLARARLYRCRFSLVCVGLLVQMTRRAGFGVRVVGVCVDNDVIWGGLVSLDCAEGL